MLKIKKFDKQIEKEKQKAQELYNKKQNTVVCQYCGQLLKKEEALYQIQQRIKMHELVAQAFCINYKKGKVIHHIDYNNQNNYYKNLYICDRKEHTTIHNLTDTLIRELIKNGNVKFDGGKYYVCKNK